MPSIAVCRYDLDYGLRDARGIRMRVWFLRFSYLTTPIIVSPKIKILMY